MELKIHVLCLVLFVVCNLGNASEISTGHTRRQKRDTVEYKNAKNALMSTLDNWRNGVQRFYVNGVRVDSDAQDVSRTVQKFSQSIGQAGNAFIFSLHGTGARNVRTGELHPYADLPSSNKVKRLSMIYNEKSPKSDELETAFSKTYNFRSRKSHRNRLVLPKALRPLVSF
ncbi:uncharacterized protein LOC113369804 [Ctenocephalides felis]|uniref:uncharacterized protein LOC113369804 n=1 Tax=Ctenocephalides felis TaxID=7515 RepID=UPI000E6E43F6|nr:uncharacterized protein LOC113369804 [Ctenocephalides felis]